MIPWLTVSSSWLDAVHYDAGDLYVRFKDKNGAHTVTCHYENVPLETWTGLLTAPSKGEFFHASGLINHPYKVIG